MRIIRLKLKKDVNDYLRGLCAQHRINDLPLAQDIYALAALKGRGLPTAARVLKLEQAYATALKISKLTVKVAIRKRRQFLASVAANPGFLVLTRSGSKRHPREVTERMLEFYLSLYRKVRQARCVSCQYLANCDFGKQYGSSISSVTVVYDPDYTKKMHADCPDRPKMDSLAQVIAAQEEFKAMAENPSQLALTSGEPDLGENLSEDLKKSELFQANQAQDSDTDDNTIPRSVEDEWEDTDADEIGLANNSAPSFATDQLTVSFSTPLVKVDLKMVDKIQTHAFALFEMAKTLAAKLTKAHSGKLKPTAETSDKSNTQLIESIDDVRKVRSVEHGRSDDEFAAKLANRSLTKRQNLRPESKKHLIYVVLDVSTSMQSVVGTGSTFWSVVSRSLLASSFALAIARLVKAEDGIMFVRYFEGTVGPLMEARTGPEFDMLERAIVRCAYDGSSTNIAGALDAALSDITGASSELRQAEILLITDCGCSLLPQWVNNFRTRLGKTVLNVLDVASNSDKFELAAGATLRAMADKYYKADGHAKTLDALVALVGNKKKGGGK